jgi:hypothetical protein
MQSIAPRRLPTHIAVRLRDVTAAADGTVARPATIAAASSSVMANAWLRAIGHSYERCKTHTRKSMLTVRMANGSLPSFIR